MTQPDSKETFQMKRAPIFLALISALAVSSALLAQQTSRPRTAAPADDADAGATYSYR